MGLRPTMSRQRGWGVGLTLNPPSPPPPLNSRVAPSRESCKSVGIPDGINLTFF